MANIVKAKPLARAKKRIRQTTNGNDKLRVKLGAISTQKIIIRQTGSGIKRVSLKVNRRTKIRVRRA